MYVKRERVWVCRKRKREREMGRGGGGKEGRDGER